MNIQKALRADLTQILDLQKACYQQEAELYDDYEISPMLQTLESITEDFEHQVFLKVAAADRIIGSVRGQLTRDTCNIGRLIVHQDFQNRGWGQRLMNALEEQFPTAQRYKLFTGHRSVKNLSLYQKLGYTEFRRERVNPRLTVVFLEKTS